MIDLETLFDIRGFTAVMTGGTGVLGSVMALALAKAGAKVAILSRQATSSAKVIEAIHAAQGEAISVACDVLKRKELEDACREVLKTFGTVDILINAAGGNAPQATTSVDTSFFDLDVQAIERILNVNFTGTLQSCQVFGRSMAEQGQGCIVNIASMSAIRPLTRVPAYSAAKAAVVNFTQWLAVHMAQEYGPNLRVNALSPGFFMTEQNRYLLTDPQTGAMTPRGQTILNHTPMGRYGAPEDLVGTLLWLVSPASAFVTGTVIPVDGGFSAYSGV